MRPKIKLAVLGRVPPDFNPGDLARWKSSIFEVDPNIESFDLNEDAKGFDWEYTDQQLEKYLAGTSPETVTLIMLSVRLQDNWYVRRLSGNRVLFTFWEMDQILRIHNLPLKNIALRVLYSISLVYRMFGNRVPLATERTDYAHDETRGCLFDMNPSKVDVVYSCHQPALCDQCVAKLKAAQLSNEAIRTVQSEIRRIRKPLFQRIVDFVRAHPLWSLLFSVITALVLGTSASLLAAFIFDAVKG